MDELLHFGRHVGTGRGEYVGILQTNLLAHQAQHGLVDQLIFHLEPYGRTFAAGKVFYVVLAANLQRVVEDAALHG